MYLVARKLWLVSSLIVAIFCLIYAPSANAAKKVALVIGTDQYQHLPVLQKAVNDARAITDTLQEIGFTVIKGENLSRREMNKSLSRLEGMIEPGDQVFFFFAGHGVALGATNYLIPADMPMPEPGEESLVSGEAFAVDQIVERIQSRGARASFVVLDACRNNPFKQHGTRSIGSSRGLRDVAAPNGVFVLFSAGIGQTALDRLNDNDPNPNSVFTRNLVPLLKVPGLSHVQLAKRVQSEVDSLARTVRHEQQPAYYDQVIGNMFLVKGEAKRQQKAVSNKPSSSLNEEARNIYNDIKNSGDVEALAIFAKQFPDSIYAKFARRKIEILKSDSSTKTKVVSLDTSSPSIRRSIDLLDNCDRLAADGSDPDNRTELEIDFHLLVKNTAQAIKACELAISSYPEDPQSAYQLGRSYEAAKQYKKAEQHYLGAVDKGHQQSMYIVAGLYHGGAMEAKSLTDAVPYYERAMALGNYNAALELYFQFYEGLDIQKDYYKAVSALFQYLLLNPLEAEAVEDVKTTYKLWEPRVRRELQRKLRGEGFYDGQINGYVTEEVNEAIKNASKEKIIAAKTHENVQNTIIPSYRRSDQSLRECDRFAADEKDLDNLTDEKVGLEILVSNFNSAIKACQLAQNRFPSDRQTAYQLGRSFHVAKKYESAAKYYTQAMEMGHTEATVNMAVLYYRGQGVPKNIQQAEKFFHRAADSGHIDAAATLVLQFYQSSKTSGNYEKAIAILLDTLKLENEASVNFVQSIYKSRNEQFRKLMQGKLKQMGYYKGPIDGQLTKQVWSAINQVAKM